MRHAWSVHLRTLCVNAFIIVTKSTSAPLQENERTKDLIIEQRFHRAIIGQKGEKIKEVRDKFPEVNWNFI